MNLLSFLLGLMAMVVALLAWAWFDGGLEPVRPIAQSVPVPELPR